MLIEVMFKSTEELDHFIGELQKFGSTKTQLINRDLKLSIRSMNLSPGGGLLSGVIHVEVPGTGMVDMLIHSILRIKGVQKAYRVNN